MSTSTTAPTPALTPFSISPDPTALYMTANLRAVVYRARYSCLSRQGLSVILADVGCGKSTVMRYLFAQLSAMTGVLATFIPTPSFHTSFGMLKKICADFEIPAARSELAQQEALEAFVVKQFDAGQNVILFIDEAQRLSAPCLETLRVFLNFETAKVKLIQLVLAGQLELRDRLLTPKHKPLLSRIFAPCLLGPLEYTEMVEMLKSRCTINSVPWPFSGDDCTRIVYEASGGIPRAALKACQMAYGLMLELNVGSIDRDLIADVLQGADLHASE